MLRITPRTEGRAVILAIEGHLIGPWVAALEQACAAVNENAGELKLDLAEVAFADHAGARLLARLGGKAELSGCSPFLREQIRRHAEAGPDRFKQGSPDA